jgi:hypothetical protein
MFRSCAVWKSSQLKAMTLLEKQLGLLEKLLADRDTQMSQLLAANEKQLAAKETQMSQLLAAKETQMSQLLASNEKQLASHEKQLDIWSSEFAAKKAEVMMARGTLSRRALYELALRTVWIPLYTAEHQKSTSPRFNATQCEGLLVKHCANASLFPTSLATDIADCAQRHKLATGLYARLSESIHGAGLDIGTLQVKHDSQTDDEHNLMQCLMRCFGLLPEEKK